MTTLTDTDMMPFGKFGPKEGDHRAMQDVPISYLHYLWCKGFNAIKPVEVLPIKEYQLNSYLVAMYIRDNLEALKQEDEDRIW